MTDTKPAEEKKPEGQPGAEAPKQPSPERIKKEQESLQKDLEAFNAELIPLLGKYHLGLGAEPSYIRDERGFFLTLARPVMFRDWGKDGSPFEDEKVEEKKSDVVSSEE